MTVAMAADREAMRLSTQLSQSANALELPGFTNAVRTVEL
jgi:hypothetical protein